MPLSDANIESELSYAYLHAIATRGGLNCKIDNRHGDNYAVDALVDHFAAIPGSYRSDVTLRIQLKATINRGTETDTHISYFFRGVNQYNLLRNNSGEPHRILVVMFLPNNADEWLSISPDELVLKQAAYWVSLYGANACNNDTGQTIYLPKVNLLTSASLVALCQSIGRGQLPSYTTP